MHVIVFCRYIPEFVINSSIIFDHSTISCIISDNHLILTYTPIESQLFHIGPKQVYQTLFFLR